MIVAQNPLDCRQIVTFLSHLVKITARIVPKEPSRHIRSAMVISSLLPTIVFENWADGCST